MSVLFAKNLRKLREERGLSQKQLGSQMFVNHSTIARWENGSRLPDAAMIVRLSRCLGVDANTLFQLAARSVESPNVIMVDDNKIILSDGLAVLEEVMPDATIAGFIWPLEAIEYARMNRIDLAVLDIEMGTSSGLELCHTLQEINPTTFNLCRSNMFLHHVNYNDFDIRLNDTLLHPEHIDMVKDGKGCFDCIVSNPPYSLKWVGKENPLLMNDPRYADAGILAPGNAADMAFVLHMYYHLKDLLYQTHLP